MVDRRRGPEPGTPEYNWLYGDSGPAAPDATRRRPEQPAADATRVMPATQPAPPPRMPPPAPKPPGPSLPRPRFRPIRWVKWVLLLWLVFLLAVPFWALREVSSVDAFPGDTRPGEQGGTTYLIVGSDSRKDLTPAQRRALGTGGASGKRTDTIMLLHLGAGPNLLLSIPRDSLVPVPGHGTTKINAAYAFGGPQLLIRTIEQNTGVRIDNYVEIGFGGFVDVVDAVGGIEICPERAMKDKLAKLDIEKGCQEADGAVALGYARSRHTDRRYGDITRARHQREVVSAVGREAVSPASVVNPFRYWNLNMAAAQTLTVSEGTGPVDLARFAWAMTRVDGDKGLTCGVPIRDLAVHWDRERALALFGHLKENDTEAIGSDLCTPTGLPKSVTG